MPEPHLRAADADREAVAAALGRHMAAGRLSLAEYEDRVAQAWSARTYGDLASLTADLPASPSAAASPPGSADRATGRAAWPSSSSPVRAWSEHGGSAGHGWQSWATTSVTVLVVYLATALGTQELHYFWPIWVIGPWGAALLVRTVAGNRIPGVDRPRAG
jgi:hypothetical protein